VVREPRHATWFSPQVAALLEEYGISRVAADPPPVPAAAVSGGWPRLAYFRLHGSPRTSWSRYDETYIAMLAVTVRSMHDRQGGVVRLRQHGQRRHHRDAWELRERATSG